MLKYIFKNAVFLLFGRVVFKGFIAVLTIILARFLGVERFGMYSTAIAFAGIFMIVNDLGMNAYMVREGSRDKSKVPVLFGNALVIEIVMSAILYVAIIIASHVLKYPPELVCLISLMGIATLIYEARKIFQGALETQLKFKIIGWQQIIYSALLFGLTAIILFVKPTLNNIAYVQIFVSIIVLIIIAITLSRSIKPKFNIKLFWPMISGAFAFCLSQLFFVIYFQTDTVILSIFRSQHEVGLYSSVYKLVVALFIFVQIIIRTCTPVIYKIGLNEREKLKRIYRTMLKYVSAFGLACSIGLWFLAKPVILLAYGKKYEAATIILQILAWFIFARFLNSTLSTYLLSTAKQNRRAALQGVAAFLNLGLNLLLIPRWGFIAAAGTTLLSEIFLLIAYYIIMTRDFKERVVFFLKPIFVSIIPALLMAVVLMFTRDKFHVIINCGLGALTFVVSLFVFRFFGEYDKKLIKEIVSRKADDNPNSSETNSN